MAAAAVGQWAREGPEDGRVSGRALVGGREGGVKGESLRTER